VQQFESVADSWENPDFVKIVIHSYRHRYGNAPTNQEFAEAELILQTLPVWRRGSHGTSGGLAETETALAGGYASFCGGECGAFYAARAAGDCCGGIFALGGKSEGEKEADGGGVSASIS
jgi:hypothetical protein